MANFNELINQEVPVLVDFSAEWCGPCKMLAPILKQLADKTDGKMKIYKIDVDKNPELARQYQISGVPTMMLFHHGKQEWRKSGVMDVASLYNVVKPYLN